MFVFIIAALGFGGLAVVVAAQVKKTRMEAEASVDQQTVEEEKVYPEND